MRELIASGEARPLPTLPRHRPARRAPAWVPTAAGWLATVIGLVDLASALTPEIGSRTRVLNDYVPGTYSHAASAATVVAGLSLILLSGALRHRKHRAWQLVTALLALSVGLHLAKGLDYEEAIASAALFAALVWHRRAFYAVPDPRTRWRALGAFVVLSGTSIGLGLLLLALHSSSIAGPHSLTAQLQEVLARLVGATGPLHYRNDHTEDLVGHVLLGLGCFSGATTAYFALKPSPQHPTLTVDDESRMRGLITAHGEQDSLAYFALRRDKSVVWSPSGKSCIAYRVVNGVMLASGDPLGDPEAWPAAMSVFLAEADRHAWIPAVIGCGERAGQLWERNELTPIELGDEAIVEVDGFTLEGRTMRGVRQAVARIERAGYSAQVRRTCTLSGADITALRAQAADWRGAEVERGFSMALGRFGDAADGDAVVVTAEQDGRLRGLLHFVPWGTDGLSLDLMRRDAAADNGLNEFLIVSAIRAAPSLGVQRLSLNFAVFRSALEHGARLGAGPFSRAWRGVLLFLSRWFQIESLYRFNAKFQPIWMPRFVCYRRVAEMPRVAVAALTAEAFIVWPRPLVAALARVLIRPA